MPSRKIKTIGETNTSQASRNRDNSKENSSKVSNETRVNLLVTSPLVCANYQTSPNHRAKHPKREISKSPSTGSPRIALKWLSKKTGKRVQTNNTRVSMGPKVAMVTQETNKETLDHSQISSISQEEMRV